MTIELTEFLFQYKTKILQVSITSPIGRTSLDLSTRSFDVKATCGDEQETEVNSGGAAVCPPRDRNWN